MDGWQAGRRLWQFVRKGMHWTVWRGLACWHWTIPVPQVPVQEYASVDGGRSCHSAGLVSDGGGVA